MVLHLLTTSCELKFCRRLWTQVMLTMKRQLTEWVSPGSYIIDFTTCESFGVTYRCTSPKGDPRVPPLAAFAEPRCTNLEGNFSERSSGSNGQSGGSVERKENGQGKRAGKGTGKGQDFSTGSRKKGWRKATLELYERNRKRNRKILQLRCVGRAVR